MIGMALAVHSMAAKSLAQKTGLGVCHLSRAMAEPEVAADTLVIKQTDEA